MDGREKDQRRTEAGERIEALVEEALREIAAPAAVNLRPGVMRAWDERARRVPRLTLPLLKPAAVLAGIVALVAATLLVWQQVPVPAPSPGKRGQAPLTEGGQALLAAPTGDAAPAAERPAAPARAAARRPRRPLVEVEFPVEQVTADLLSLPGAPAGEPGDGIPPLPGALSIPMAPIGPAPTVSDMSRPVSDFPAGDSRQSAPGAEHGEPGQSGGPRR